MQKSVSFKNRKGLTLRGVVHKPKEYGTAVVMLHGFPGTAFGKGRRSKKTALFFEKNGILALRFDFSGTNRSEGRFEDKLMSREVDDTKYAVDFVVKNYRPRRIVLLGHSTGAIDASLYACRDKRIDRLILSGAVSDLKHAVHYDFTDEQVRDFWTKGYIIYRHRKEWGKYWTDGKKLRKAFYDEFFRLDIPGSMRRYRKPLLIIHGEKDQAVPLKEARELYAICNRPKKLVIIRNAGHSYDETQKTFDEYNRSLVRFVKGVKGKKR